ncbi:MAG: hypothetical protein K2W91_03575, partial [Novosphingobium sp.]|nr:hypothetical protein [Novosphingobium sp.]
KSPRWFSILESDFNRAGKRLFFEVAVNDVGHMHSVIALRVGNGGRNHPADQGSQNQQQTEEPTAHCTPASMSAAVR